MEMYEITQGYRNYDSVTNCVWFSIRPKQTKKCFLERNKIKYEG